MSRINRSNYAVHNQLRETVDPERDARVAAYVAAKDAERARLRRLNRTYRVIAGLLGAAIGAMMAYSL